MRSVKDVIAVKTSSSLGWAPYAACAWALLFGALSFYWALGGTFLADTLPSGLVAMAHDPGFLAVVWLTGVVKVVAGLGALVLARGWLPWMPRTLKLFVAWAGGVGLLLYGAFPFVVGVLLLTGVLPHDASVDWDGMRWHVALWDPWWMLGGVLFLLTAWWYQRTTSVR